ncbi:MAG: hypothetical protein ROZ09_12055 [Thiobacillus sp.]|jgi:hypothetical protein|uniref:hypothetical protein n=1 Tax=Thiobacillus sp. TaxID=924 RepID=UPI002895590A|nr:hypothetical protein [Thiobacillus sp.]MDT3707552.1 hypothetical protein [Thiobacillus sp.]
MRLITTGLLCVCAGLAQAAGSGHNGHGDAPPRGAPRAWTDLPLIEVVPGRDRRQATFRLVNLEAASIKAFAPGERAPLPEGVRFKSKRPSWDILPDFNGRFALQSQGVGNYHWLLARQESPESVIVASTAHYFPNPGPAPTDMLARSKSELEIAPAPLPREHNRYRENQAHRFEVRFQGAPLAGATVSFTNSAGTRTQFVSDSAGRVRVQFPEDVQPAATGRHGRGPANSFVLAVAHDAGGRHYLTAFNYSYGEDGYTGRSLAWGGGFMALGSLIALPLIVRRKESKRG